jgi:hypothetical protein
VASSVLEVISEGIDALMRADSEHLARLASQSGEMRPPANEAERRMAAGRYRALRRLLELTRRNIRLLGGVAGSTGEYGVRRDC